MSVFVSDHTPKRLDLLMVRGDTYEMELHLKDEIDVTTITAIYLTVKRAARDDEPIILQKSINDGIAITDADKGIVHIRIAPEDTAKAKPGNYVYDVQYNLSGRDKYTLLGGAFVLKPDVTVD